MFFPYSDSILAKILRSKKYSLSKNGFKEWGKDFRYALAIKVQDREARFWRNVSKYGFEKSLAFHLSVFCAHLRRPRFFPSYSAS